MDFLTILQILDSTLRLATPLLLTCLAGLFSERAGIVDIGLEGKLLAAAFLSGAVAYTTGSIWLGLLAGVAASMLFSMLHGLASITFQGDQLISGVALNFLAAGLTVVIGQSWFRLGGRTPSLPTDARFGEWNLPFSDAMSKIPAFGPAYDELISGHTALTYIALLAVPISWWVLYRTRFGLRLRAVGENPSAVDTAGISVVRLRYIALIIAGALCGLAGTYLASLAAGFVKDMSAGRGYIALAALIFAKWRPWYALSATLLFGLLEAVGNRYQNIQFLDFVELFSLLGFAALAVVLAVQIIRVALSTISVRDLAKPFIACLSVGAVLVATTAIRAMDLPLFGFALPVQFMQALPYILTVVILAGFIGKAIPPRASGTPYVKER
ncbi:nucleoside ABC transporter membrane protein [Pacificibacter maritimus]|uniref:Nucleoside ABC transporter membrane protein n=1 Tax=Pacificibacter maritimus TaxID=762213 RepID=A0A3N4V2W8_9RHOB|nr:ABC transporter permease [Pacificibacter maritimus]RPE67284.1 nucleoside ABC transporter membrane protein [Pacificibacter maritimus]